MFGTTAGHVDSATGRAGAARPTLGTPWRRGVLGLIALAACAQPPGPRDGAQPEGAAGQTEVVVIAEENVVPAGGDGGPRLSLAFRTGGGRLQPIAEKALAFAPFRDGVALIALDQRLVLVSPDGSRSVLARRAGAAPRQGARGELWYVARYERQSEVHVLEASGRDRIVASGLASAGLLAPQPDGRLLMVAADARGVAGLWVVEASGARCLTNCELVAGEPWAERFMPLPERAEGMRRWAGERAGRGTGTVGEGL